jgi:integrating conjugative element protein (TIGR03749 family)
MNWHVRLCALLLCSLPCAQADQILRWERIPLSIELIVGEERVVFLEQANQIRAGMPASLEQSLRIQTAGNTVYLRASAPFEAARLQLEDTTSGVLVLVDVRATERTAGVQSLEPARIVSPDASSSEESVQLTPETPASVILTRYAAQSLYAPLRTVEALPGARQMPVSSETDLSTLLPEVAVRAQALATWRLGELWVTAVKLKHLETGWVDLDPRALQGDFVAATFQHQNLGPAGEPSDTTVVYLITRDGGLSHKLLPAIRRFDTRGTYEK